MANQTPSISDPLFKKYYGYLKLEKNLLNNSIEAYISDIQKLSLYASDIDKSLVNIGRNDIIEFMASLHDLGIGARSQARILSGIKAFYKYLMLDGYMEVNPTDLIEGPKLGLKLPEVLSVEEINLIIDSIGRDTMENQRNTAILETLYSCGLRVSEMTQLCFSDLYLKEGYIIVKGKGEKHRVVPISDKAIKEIELYTHHRCHQVVKKDCEDYVFISRLGRPLSRIMIFNIIKKQAEMVGITKTVSPHTFRHSFATHLLEGGANLRAIQMMLGHEKITTTEIYIHLDKHILREEILLHHPRNKKDFSI